ncbi:major facilitator superfamily transporter [Microdochium trichocladiopsis]|uniref:Major facilitator superfamily transporter n=1 Tax=Microdochium trichocladiopsis TaxID=1682393 RepID=A0A9P9BNF4_9PEZI|nr:major facilitator superfamily transporter [Microdochium trichocladiopsis]KAH7027324.1 major facilitator superfamily transporter [Microdochium trichocladiopsis]
MAISAAPEPEVTRDEKQKASVEMHMDDGDNLKRADGEGPDLLAVEDQYTKEEYHKLKRKVDKWLLPLMWVCHGIQMVDKTSIAMQAVFGLRKDTGLVGQQTVFYMAYMVFEFPSTVIMQRFKMGMSLSLYMIIWGVCVLGIGFCQNFTQLLVLRLLQGAFECSISPGFLLLVGTWYTRREHTSRSLIFGSSNAGFGVIAKLVIYGIGVATQNKTGLQPWRYISFFLGGLTILAGTICLFVLGTPAEVRWLTEEEKTMARARVIGNNTGHDTTAIKSFKYKHIYECLRDPCFWFSGINAFLGSVPNGGVTTMSSILMTTFGFTNLQAILIEIPRSVTSVVYFLIVGLVTSKKADLRLYFMLFSCFPSLAGFLGMSLLPNDPAIKWQKWACFYITVPFVLTTFLAWTLIPSNVAGRTKRTLTSSFTFVGYCVGNMAGSQIYMEKDAPRYIPGTVGCVVAHAIQIVLVIAWRLVLVRRNRTRRQKMQLDGISEEERVRRAKQFGEQDYTDFENPYFLYTL